MPADPQQLTPPGRHHSFDGMCWVIPSDEANEVAWSFIHSRTWGSIGGGPTDGDLMLAAEYVAAYRNLIALPARERERIVREIKAEMKRRKTAAKEQK